MKRLRSSEDLDSYGKESNSNPNPNPNLNPNPNPNPNLNPNPSRPSLSSHRSFYYKSDNVRKGVLSSSPSAAAAAAGSRYDWDRSAEDDREGSRMVRKRSEHDFDGFDRRKGFDRYGGGGGDNRGYDRSLLNRSESFCGPRRDFPKGFRSERDRPRREGSVTTSSSWRRIGGGGDERGKGLRDVRSPSWSNSRDSGSDQPPSRVRSPVRGFRDSAKSVSLSKSKSKSPTWSKDSVGSEQSKCFEVNKKKSEEVRVEMGSNSSSEMEEGELEPEPEPEPEPESENPETESKARSVSGPEAESEKKEDTVCVQSKERVEEDKGKKEETCAEKESIETNAVSEEKGADMEIDGLAKVENLDFEKSNSDSAETRNECIGEKAEEGKAEEGLKVDTESKDEAAEVTVEENYVTVKSESGIEVKEKAVVFEEEEEEETVPSREIAVVGENEKAETLAQSFKDKGKAVAVSVTLSPIRVEDPVRDEDWSERDVEGPSSRGFELFGNSPVRKQERAAVRSGGEDKLSLEPLDLSLSLPNVLLPIGEQRPTTSVQSLSNTFRSNSENFTASVSYSGSQSVYHNPSCSLTQMTQTSLDNLEQSVKSRPIFQGIDWQALSQNNQNEPKSKDVPLYQRLLMNGQSGQAQHPRLAEGSSKMANGSERQLSFHKRHNHHHDHVNSPSNSVGSHDNGSSYSFDRKRLSREKSSGGLYRSSSSKMDQEQVLSSGADFVETVIGRIVSEPIPSMARKFHEMTNQSLQCLKDSIRAILSNIDKHRRQVSSLQKILRERSDITSESLHKSHRTQLEILLALKTNAPEFLTQETSFSTTELVEIFLNQRCRNPSCRSQVPVDECECKVCSQKNGFCSACMCQVCSKFDTASNTCSWVGCDVCLHWCHADCGLRESHIRNGSAHGSSEMQFHCVACGLPSEMFGFVKEVFQNFAKDWTAEALSKELEYVKRIFAESKDSRGRRLNEIAGQLIARLINKSQLPEVYSYIMGYLNDSDSFKSTTTPLPSVKQQSKPSHSNIPGSSHEQPTWLKPIYSSEKVPQLDITPTSLLPSYTYDRTEKRSSVDLPISTQNEPLFDELESIVRVKLAEAKMFQSRSDEARREAEGLQRIAFAKNEKIEEEYTARIAKLRLAESEQNRKQKFEELQALERSHREYFNMKMRMESEIKDLLLKMEATKRNLSA